MLIKDGMWRLANLNLWWSKWSTVAQTRLFSYFHWLMDSCYHISCLVGPIATGWFSYSRLSHLGCPKFGKAMPWHQSQIRSPMFQHIQNTITPESNSKEDTLDQIQVTRGLGLSTTVTIPTVSSTHYHKTSFPAINIPAALSHYFHTPYSLSEWYHTSLDHKGTAATTVWAQHTILNCKLCSQTKHW